jgi:anti-sigma B factor antagonist
MECKDKIIGDVAIVTLRGRIIGTQDSERLHEEVQCLLKDGIKKIVFDLHEVNWMGSLGVGGLMHDLISARNAGGDLRFARLTTKVESLFKITKLETVVQIYKDVDQAVKSFELN